MCVRSWLLVAVCVIGVACSQQTDHKGKTPLVEVEGNFLYKEDVAEMLPVGLTVKDSIDFVNRYIRKWVEDVLFYKKSVDNIPNDKVLEEKVEQYRRALILHEYQQELIDQKLTAQLTEEEIRAYFEGNKSLFLLDGPLIKGLFIKVPSSSPQLSKVRQWYKSSKQTAVEHLEKYSLQYAVKYEYFYDKWVSLSEILGMLPMKEDKQKDYWKRESAVELKDSMYHYFLHITDFLPAGAEAPFEYAEPRVREVLGNVRKANFLRQMRSDLYEKALKENKIKYINLDTE